MNGELFQICRLVTAAKQALREEAPIQYTPGPYEEATAFVCLPEASRPGAGPYTAPHVEAWFAHMRQRGLEDVKLLCPVDVPDRNILGFVNITGSAMICFRRGGLASAFTGSRHFDSVKKRWSGLYTEQELSSPPPGKPRFQNPTPTFRQTLLEIQALAVQIDCPGFARIFERARVILDGAVEAPRSAYSLPLPQERCALFDAADCADVFGAMGSWNDTPPCLAGEKGLSREDDRLSDALLRQIRLAILYAVNEW